MKKREKKSKIKGFTDINELKKDMMEFEKEVTELKNEVIKNRKEIKKCINKRSRRRLRSYKKGDSFDEEI